MKKSKVRKVKYFSIGIVGILLIIIVNILCVREMYREEIKKYSEEDYKIIENEISKSVPKPDIKGNHDIVFSNTNNGGPEIEYITLENTDKSEISYRYNVASIKVVVDKNNKIISKTRNFDSFEEYKNNRYLCCLWSAIASILMLSLFLVLCLIVAYKLHISKFFKNF